MLDDTRLGQLQRKRERALLSLRRKRRRVAAIHAQQNIITMHPRRSAAGAFLIGAGGHEHLKQAALSHAWHVLRVCLFSAAQRSMHRADLGLQPAHQFGPSSGQSLREIIHDTRIGIGLPPVHHGIPLQQVVAAAQGALVATQRLQVIRKNLASREVEVSAPVVGPRAKQIHVGVIHPDDEAAACEILPGVPAHGIIERKPSRGVIRGKTKPVIVGSAFDHAGLLSEADEIALRCRARRLKTQQHTCRLDERRLALRIAPDQQRALRMQLDFCIAEAAKISH